MDSFPNQQPNLNLPPIGGELGPVVNNHELGLPARAETLTSPESTPGLANQTSPPLNSTLPLNIPIPTAPSPIINNYQTQATQPVSVIPDESRDLIAKEWIMRAKRVVEQTRGDPHKQSQEFNKLKAEYVKQRYNMTIKVNNE